MLKEIACLCRNNFTTAAELVNELNEIKDEHNLTLEELHIDISVKEIVVSRKLPAVRELSTENGFENEEH